jgi:hypothetical protein
MLCIRDRSALASVSRAQKSIGLRGISYKKLDYFDEENGEHHRILADTYC